MAIDYSGTVNRSTFLDAYPLPRIDSLVQSISAYQYYSKIDLQSAYHQIPLHPKDFPFTAFEADGQLYEYVRLPFGLTNAVACFQRVMDQLLKVHGLVDTFAYLDDIIICGVDRAQHDSNLERFLKIVEDLSITLNKDKCVFSTSVIDYLGYRISHNSLTPDPIRFQALETLEVPQSQAALLRAIGFFAYYARWVPHYSERIKPLLDVKIFRMSDEAQSAFVDLKKAIKGACLAPFSESLFTQVETDASDNTLAATLSQDGRPVAFFSRSLKPHERAHSAVEKEASAIIEAVRHWRHFLAGRSFRIITDQQAVSFIFDYKRHGRTKNDKLQRWKIELSAYQFEIQYRPGRLNASADALSRPHAAAISPTLLSLQNLHAELCHPGVTRLLHYVKAKNLPFSVADVKEICHTCRTCSVLKPRFHRSETLHVIKATQPMERLAIDIVGPKQSSSSNRYLLVIVDEFSRFPFVYPLKDISSKSVIEKLTDLFFLLGTPASILSDRGTQFMAHEMKLFLAQNGIAPIRTTPYHPIGNGQCERINGLVWKTIQLALMNRKLPESQWEIVLPEALHAIRSLLCTATNTTPHERFLGFQRRSAYGKQLPSWLLETGPVLLRRFVRNKSDPLVDEVKLIECHHSYATVQFPNGSVDTVSIRDLAPLRHSSINKDIVNSSTVDDRHSESGDDAVNDLTNNGGNNEDSQDAQQRRSSRIKKPPNRLDI